MELRELWRQSFGDTEQCIELYFSRFFKPRDCVVCRADGHIACMAHLLPAQIWDGSKKLRCHYLYAAATLPRFRGNGLMGLLLRYAADYGRKRGDAYSVLVPSSASLFEFYKRHGYRTLAHCETVTLSRAYCIERTQGLEQASYTSKRPDFDAMLRVRERALLERPGSLMWDRPALERAAAMDEVYGGFILQPDASCYAFVSRDNDRQNVLNVSECITDEKGFDKIIVAMLKLCYCNI